MIDKIKTSEVNHRIAIRHTINCIWKIVLLTIIIALIGGGVIVVSGFSTMQAISGSVSENTSKIIAIIELIVFIILAIIYIWLTIYWIVKAIKKNNQATEYDRNLNNKNMDKNP